MGMNMPALRTLVVVHVILKLGTGKSRYNTVRVATSKLDYLITL